MAKKNLIDLFQTWSDNRTARKINASNNRASVRITRAQTGTNLGAIANNYTDKVIAPVVGALAPVAASFVGGKMGGGAAIGGGVIPTPPVSNEVLAEVEKLMNEPQLAGGNPAAPQTKGGFFTSDFFSFSNPFLYIIGVLLIGLGWYAFANTKKKRGRGGL